MALDLPELPEEESADSSKWLDNFLGMRKSFISLGRVILGTREGERSPVRISGSTCVDIAAALSNSVQTRDVIEDALQEAFDYDQYSDHLKSHLTILRIGFAESIDDTLCLLAVKTVLNHYVDAKVAAGRAYNVSLSTSGNAGVDAKGGVVPPRGQKPIPGDPKGQGGFSGSADITATMGVDKHSNLAGSYAWLLVPLIPLIEEMVLYSSPIEHLGMHEIIDLAMRRLLKPQLAREMVKMRGGIWEEQQRLYLLRTERPSQEEYIEYGRRLGKPDGWAENKMLQRGIGVQEDRDIFEELYNEIPTIQDHLHWLQRNAFDLQYVEDFKLLEGFESPESLPAVVDKLKQVYGNPQGKPNFWKAFGKDLNILGMKQEYAAFHYASHWILPAPGQLAEMLQRLRPGVVDQSIEFTEANYLRSLAEQDVAPYFRARLKAIAYSVPGIRFIRQLYNTDTWNYERVVSAFQDIGYEEKVARDLALAIQKQRARDWATQGHGFTPAELYKMLLDYGITEQQVKDEMARQFYTTEQVDLLINRVKVEHEAARKKEQIAAVKKAVLSGGTSVSDAFMYLTNLKLTTTEANALTDSWQNESNQANHPVNKTELIKWYKDGLINAQELLRRLSVLGYKPVDARGLLAEVSHDIAAARQATATKAVEKAAKQSAALVKARELLSAKSQKLLQQLAILKTRALNAEEAAAFDHELDTLSSAIAQSIESIADKSEQKRLKSALQWANKYDKATMTEIARLNILRTQGIAIPALPLPVPPPPVGTEAVVRPTQENLPEGQTVGKPPAATPLP